MVHCNCFGYCNLFVDCTVPADCNPLVVAVAAAVDVVDCNSLAAGYSHLVVGQSFLDADCNCLVDCSSLVACNWTAVDCPMVLLEVKFKMTIQYMQL